MPRPDSIATLRSKLNAIQVGNLVGASSASSADTAGKGSDKTHAPLQTESNQVKGSTDAEKGKPTDIRAEKVVVSETNGTTASNDVPDPLWLCMEKVLTLLFLLFYFFSFLFFREDCVGWHCTETYIHHGALCCILRSSGLAFIMLCCTWRYAGATLPYTSFSPSHVLNLPHGTAFCYTYMLLQLIAVTNIKY